MNVDYALGIDLGGSHTRVMGFAADGNVFSEHNADFDQKAPMAWAEQIRASVKRLQEERGAPRWAGLGAPGLASADARAIDWMPGRLNGLEGLNWTKYLGLPVPVWVLNDAHGALMGEVWQGAAKGCRNVVLLTLGTGVGGAILCDGHLLRGHIGRAGHLGHISLDADGTPDICGVPGSLEDLVGNCTIQKRTDGKFQTTHDLVHAYEKGDSVASEFWLRAMRDLACGLTSIINAVDPEVIVLGGGIARAGAALFEPLRRELDKIEWRPGDHRVQLRPAQLGEKAGAYGAAYNAIQLETP